MRFGANFEQAVRAGQAELARHAQARLAPTVVWQRIGEASAAFDLRIAVIRDSLPDRQALLAVTRGPHPGFLAGARLVSLAPKMFDLLHPDAPSRYRVASGGRGSAKSRSFADALVLRMVERPTRILACREVQRSIRESIHRLLTDRVDELGLSPWFELREHSISAANGSEVIYEGLLDNVSRIKSLEDIDICYTEEAENVSDRSIEVLIPTIRNPGSEIWIGLNPDRPEDPVYKRFITSPPPDCRHVHVTFADNPWFPPVLEAARADLQRVDPDAYAHVWLGECRQVSDAQVLKGKCSIEAFEPVIAQPGVPRAADAPRVFDGPYYGVDWGFSIDPTVLVRCWISDRTLFIEHEAYKVGCDIDRTPALFDAVPDARRHVVRADSARPETINYLRRHGYPRMTAVEKGKNSVEDGIAHLRSYEKIVIHPRCEHAIEEARLYSYKVDRLSGDPLPDIVDKHNHVWDAVRYALQPIIRKRNSARIVPLGEWGIGY